MRRLSKLIEFSMNEWLRLLCFMLLLPLIAVSLKISGFVATRKFLELLLPTKELVRQDYTENDVRTVARMIKIAAIFGPYRANCLRQSLLLWWVMMRRGINVYLRIGVNHENEKFMAHSWVEWNGEILIGGFEEGKKFARLM